jgi:hypothetical protein
MSNGHRIVLAFFTLMYVVPLAGHLVFKDVIASSYWIVPLSMTAALQLVLTYILFAFMHASRAKFLPEFNIGQFSVIVRFAGRVYARWRLPIATIAVAIGAWFAYSGANSFQYTAQSISERSPGAVAMIAFSSLLRTALIVDTCLRMLGSTPDAGSRTRRWFFENVLVSTALVLLATGVATLWVSLMALAHALKPGLGFRSMFAERGRSRLASFAAIVGITSSLLVAWYFGSIIRSSSSTAIADLWELDVLRVMGVRVNPGDDPLRVGLLYLLERSSIYYYSWTYTADASWRALNPDGWVLQYPVKGLLFRLDFFLGGLAHVARPPIASITQFNYEQLTVGQLSYRVGSSPGFLGAFNYVFPFPLNVVFCALYLKWVAGRLDAMLVPVERGRLTVVGVCIAYVLLQGLFQIPFDWLLIFDESFLFAFLLWAASRSATERAAVRTPLRQSVVATATPRQYALDSGGIHLG